jgi:hypothetical protein
VPGINLMNLFSIAVAFAQQATQITVSSNIPGPNSTTSGIGSFVSNLYTFALLLAGLLAFGAIVWGGIKYATGRGNPTAESEGRSWITNALLGLLLLAGAYIILYTINPNILNLQPGALAPISTILSSGSPGPGQSGGTGTCNAAPSGPCSAAALQSTCMGSNAQNASEICMAESSGNPVNGGDPSTNGQPVSIGLFQINLTANSIGGLNCPSAFDHQWHAAGVCGKTGTGCGPSTITNPTLYAQCVAAAQNAATNISYACSLSSNGTNWSAWSTHSSCGL